MGTIFSVNGVVDSEHHVIGGGAIQVGDVPGKRSHRCGGRHGNSVVAVSSNVKDYSVAGKHFLDALYLVLILFHRFK